MSEPVKSVVLAGSGLLWWPKGEEPITYRVTLGLDGNIQKIWIGPPTPEILRRPSRHANIALHMPEGRRVRLNVAPNAYLTPDGPMERSFNGQDWWLDLTPWVPIETPDRFMLVVKAGSVQVFESHSSREEAEAAYEKWEGVEFAEVRSPQATPTRLK
ncbi:MAG: hypothetical protein ACJ746_01695 [Bryobacteraceae bacterium]